MPGESDPDEPEDSNGTLSLNLMDRTVLCTLDVKSLGDAYEKLVAPMHEVMVLLKGQADLTSTRVRYHDLAQALQEYLNDKREFPRGTADRGVNPETGLPYPPDQRLSFYGALVPYFGDDYRDWKLDAARSWNEEPNLATAGRVLPLVLAHRLANLSPARINYPGLQDSFLGATHFVGVAGLGLDAPEYQSGDAATAKKRGIFGYDRVTKRSDVRDGLDKTIALILVPADHKAPWLAGGGATVRAVSDEGEDTTPLAPFVCINYPSKKGEASKFDGKPGTLAIMGDGKVRFIPATLPAATFRALCTIAGGEQIARLDSLCPVIEDEERDLKTEAPAKTPPAAPQTPPAGTQKSAPAAQGGTPAAPEGGKPTTPAPQGSKPAAAPGQPGAQ